MSRAPASSRRQNPRRPPANLDGLDLVDKSGDAPAGDNDALADLVWKYFGELISDALIEVEELIAKENPIGN